MAIFRFELVSPERLLFAGDVEQVDVPGVEGDFGVLADHAPLVTTLRPGILTVHTADAQQKFVVLGGFAEVSAKGLTVLADIANTIEEMDREIISRRMDELEKLIEEAKQGSELDKMIRQLDQYKTVDRTLTGTAMH